MRNAHHTKRLIVNADDFGLTNGVNRAIIEGHTRGAVTSATLMANMPAFDAAVGLAKDHPSLGVGLHFNIVTGQPLSECWSLIDDRTGDFHQLSSLIFRTVARRIDQWAAPQGPRGNVEFFVERLIAAQGVAA